MKYQDADAVLFIRKARQEVRKDMFRGTSPSITFRIESELDFSTIVEVWVTLKDYENEETFEYSQSEVAIDEEAKTITISLTQEETLVFEDDSTVEIQLRLLDNKNMAYATDIYELEMKRVLKGGVITDGKQ